MERLDPDSEFKPNLNMERLKEESERAQKALFDRERELDRLNHQDEFNDARARFGEGSYRRGGAATILEENLKPGGGTGERGEPGEMDLNEDIPEDQTLTPTPTPIPTLTLTLIGGYPGADRDQGLRCGVSVYQRLE